MTDETTPAVPPLKKIEGEVPELKKLPPLDVAVSAKALASAISAVAAKKAANGGLSLIATGAENSLVKEFFRKAGISKITKLNPYSMEFIKTLDESKFFDNTEAIWPESGQRVCVTAGVPVPKQFTLLRGSWESVGTLPMSYIFPSLQEGWISSYGSKRFGAPAYVKEWSAYSGYTSVFYRGFAYSAGETPQKLYSDIRAVLDSFTEIEGTGKATVNRRGRSTYTLGQNSGMTEINLALLNVFELEPETPMGACIYTFAICSEPTDVTSFATAFRGKHRLVHYYLDMDYVTPDSVTGNFKSKFPPFFYFQNFSKLYSKLFLEPVGLEVDATGRVLRKVHFGEKVWKMDVTNYIPSLVNLQVIPGMIAGSVSGRESYSLSRALASSHLDIDFGKLGFKINNSYSPSWQAVEGFYAEIKSFPGHLTYLLNNLCNDYNGAIPTGRTIRGFWKIGDPMHNLISTHMNWYKPDTRGLTYSGLQYVRNLAKDISVSFADSSSFKDQVIKEYTQRSGLMDNNVDLSSLGRLNLQNLPFSLNVLTST